jgi:hypothetical protein
MVTEGQFLSVVRSKISGMGSSTREEIVEAFNALDDDLDRLCELSVEVFTTPERLTACASIIASARPIEIPSPGRPGWVVRLAAAGRPAPACARTQPSRENNEFASNQAILGVAS